MQIYLCDKMLLGINFLTPLSNTFNDFLRVCLLFHFFFHLFSFLLFHYMLLTTCNTIRLNTCGFFLIWLWDQITLLKMGHTSKFCTPLSLCFSAITYFHKRANLSIFYMCGGNVSFCRYIFSTEGHLLPATPEISLVQEHCSYFGAYCNTGNMRNESHASDVASNPQETNDGSLYGRVRTRFPSGSTFSDSTPISGLIKVSIAYWAFL